MAVVSDHLLILFGEMRVWEKKKKKKKKEEKTMRNKNRNEKEIWKESLHTHRSR